MRESVNSVDFVSTSTILLAPNAALYHGYRFSGISGNLELSLREFG